MDWLFISHFIKQPELLSEFQTFMPVWPLIIHYSIAINISSDCSEYNNIGVWFYLVISHLLVFGTRVGYYLYFRGTKLKPILIKSLLITLNFNAWVIVRAKPFKCLFELNEIIATIYFVKVSLIILFMSKYICKKIKENNGNQF